MAPQSQRFASSSLRYKSRPAARVVVPFRDDQSLIAFRYEQTVQAEPPIPIIPVPPRNPARASRPASSIVSGSPVIVAPPPISPNEQHPAFRIRERTPSVVEEDWKRDSGLAPTTTSSVTIREECEEESPAYQKIIDEPEPIMTSAVVLGDAKSFTTAKSRDSAVTATSDAVTGPRRVSAEIQARIRAFRTPRVVVPPPITSLSTPSSPSSPSAQSAPASAPTSPSLPAAMGGITREASKRVVRALSLRPNQQTKKLKKRAASKEREDVAPATPPKSPPPLPPKDENEPWPRPQAAQGPKPPKAPKWYLPGFGGGNKSANPCRLQSEFLPIDTTIPTDSFLEDDFLTQLTFSKRGSMMFGGKRAFGNLDLSAATSTAAASAPSSSSMGQDQTATDVTPRQGADIVEPARPTSPTLPVTTVTTATTGVSSPKPKATTPTTPTRLSTTPPSRGAAVEAGEPRQSAPQPDPPTAMSVPNIRILPVDVERESQKVRSLYESGTEIDWRDGRPGSSQSERLAPAVEVPSEGEENVASHSFSSDKLSPPNPTGSLISQSSSSLRRDSPLKREYELAGGIEDWEDVDGADVDRYGFITPNTRRAESRDGTPDEQPPKTPPQAAPGTRKRNVLVKRMDPATAAAYGYGSSSLLSPGRAPSRKVSARSLNTQTSELSTASRRSARSSIRAATNLLPHNRDRKLTDEAGDMLSMSPALSDIAEDEQVEQLSETFKRKEWERAEKWRKMAKVTNKGQTGEGMEFEFDVRSPKLIDRTWKGIPDRWRAAAWYSFLAASAKQHGSTTTDAELAAEFHRLQDVGSPDDTQIDLDVPRTINRHIMFRRPYRGGQRLLFRVLHALSLYFPDTGYVQGMASLAATLLCYYDEERTFIMLVRMWRFRGLERLYQPGFGSLMTALKDLERGWLEGKEVAHKLSELCIDPTAYATRWYLTLFNFSIPFQAQLRVWDVFMLLGEPSPIPALPISPSAETSASSPTPQAVSASTTTTATTTTTTAITTTATEDSAPPEQRATSTAGTSSSTAATAATAAAEAAALPGFDILHATGTALIHALTEVLLDSDFENAMKALTSWIPIKDEELLMKITRAEWRQHQAKKKAT